MSKFGQKKSWWLFALIFGLFLLEVSKCQDQSLSQSDLNSEAERREGKPQDSGNGKDTALIFKNSRSKKRFKGFLHDMYFEILKLLNKNFTS